MNDHTWQLRGTGRRTGSDWTALQRHTATWTTAWANVAGFHLKPGMPPRPPVTTHLWAWAEHHWLRVRIDHENWWAALLTEGEADIEPALWLDPTGIQAPHIARFRNWPREEPAIKQFQGNKDDLLGRADHIQLVPLRPQTTIFIGDDTTTDSAPE